MGTRTVTGDPGPRLSRAATSQTAIHVEAYVTWCRERGCRLDSASRAEYVTELLKS
jgi:hypothetical protein